MGKSFKPSGEPSVVQVQQRNHGDAAEGADGREQMNQRTDFYGFRPQHGHLFVVMRTPLRMRIRSTSQRAVDSLGALPNVAGAIHRVVFLSG